MSISDGAILQRLAVRGHVAKSDLFAVGTPSWACRSGLAAGCEGVCRVIGDRLLGEARGLL